MILNLGYAIVEQEMLQSFIRLAKEMELDGIGLPRENISVKEFTKMVTESKNLELESDSSESGDLERVRNTDPKSRSN